jgi:hypothetical protein
VPVTLDAVTIVFTDNGETWTLGLGQMDPIDTLVGVFKRLQNLGCLGRNAMFDFDAPSNNIDLIREGLRTLKARSDDGGPDSDAPSDSSADASPAQTAASTTQPDPTPPAGTDVDSFEGADSDDAGLGDDGTLDDKIRKLLLDAHGC